MEDINLHFTGDFHAISSAHALLSAMLDNHLHQGNALGIDPRRITWPRTIDMNDRALRDCVIGLGGVANGVVREERWVIIPASEVMAIVALAGEHERPRGAAWPHHRRRHRGRGSQARCAPRDLKASGAMALLLKDAHPPQPRADARGRAGVRARRAVRQHRPRLQQHRRHEDRARSGGHRRHRSGIRLGPGRREVLRHQVSHRRAQARGRRARRHRPRAQAAMAAPTSRNSTNEDLAALERGLPNLEKHIENVRQFGVPVVVARQPLHDRHRARAADGRGLAHRPPACRSR